MDNFRIETDTHGIALIWFDVRKRSMNTITPEVMDELPGLMERIVSDEAIKGVVFASGKTNSFCAGADLGTQRDAIGGGAMPSDEELRASFERAFRLNRLLRKLETCGKPVAMAIEAVALGGGLEIALAGHYRVASTHPKVKLGFPEATLGLLPGGGGTQRLARLIGPQKALPHLLDGKPLSAVQALGAGFIHAVVEPGETVAAAKVWVRDNGDPVQPWDQKGYSIPGGGPYTPAGSPAFVLGAAMLRKQTFGNYPALQNILQCVYEGVQVPMDAGLRIETRYFLRTRQTVQARAMIRTQFHSMQALGRGALRPPDIPVRDILKIGVLGAGMMGAGIAYVQAAAGIETVLIDTSMEAAEKGKASCAKIIEKAVTRGEMNAARGAEMLARIVPTTDYSLFDGCDMVVEAVFEDRELKADVTRKAEARLKEDAVFASNTSTLPITGLAEASARPANFIGIHFFSPVDRMALVEIIMGEKTTQETLAKAMDYAAKIRKTPIVVKDNRGFYTSRCFGTYTAEGLELFAEGVAPAIIDNVGRATGMPRGPLELYDDVALDLVMKVRRQARQDLGDRFEPRVGDAILETMVNDHDRHGRKNGRGFYDYPPDGSPKTLWPGLSSIADVKIAVADAGVIEEIRTRLLYRQAVEAARCFDEGVITDPRAADVGAVLGWGFAKWTGGPLSLIDGVGVGAFVTTCDRLAAKYGPRFSPPQLLRDLAAAGETIYGRAERKNAA
jgi:3-hydroxyacyl-CoA dehydrogenase / enoyl-CoA hydratase / 3-hydroxybutyryl-CoA epimerase